MKVELASVAHRIVWEAAITAVGDSTTASLGGLRLIGWRIQVLESNNLQPTKLEVEYTHMGSYSDKVYTMVLTPEHLESYTTGRSEWSTENGEITSTEHEKLDWIALKWLVETALMILKAQALQQAEQR